MSDDLKNLFQELEKAKKESVTNIGRKVMF